MSEPIYRNAMVVTVEQANNPRGSTVQWADADLIVTETGKVIKDRYAEPGGNNLAALALARELPDPPPPPITATPVEDPQDPWNLNVLDQAHDIGRRINEGRWAACNFDWSTRPGGTLPSMEQITAVADKVIRAFLGITGPEDDERYEHWLDVFENDLNESK